MCFSATASFTAATLLIPAGFYCFKQALLFDRNQIFFASIPLVFGIQQSIEGMLWSSQGAFAGVDAHYFVLSFLFFSHLFWLIWIPYSCYNIEPDPFRKKMFGLFTLAGATHGGLMYLPLLFYPAWMSFEISDYGIIYHTHFLYDAYISNDILRLIYAVIVLAPLLFSSDKTARQFGVFIFISLFIAAVFYIQAFVSIWCYFAAVISFYIFVVSFKLKERAIQLP